MLYNMSVAGVRVVEFGINAACVCYDLTAWLLSANTVVIKHNES